jgi:hypothetical protein
MCDYSLEMYGSRPAREGEIYVTTRFPSGSIGFASAGDPRTAVSAGVTDRASGWRGSRDCLRPARGRPLSRRSTVDGRAFCLAAGSAAGHSRLCAGAVGA